MVLQLFWRTSSKKRKIKHVTPKWKTSVIILQVFVFDKTYHLVLKDSTLVHPERAPSVHSRVHLLKVYFFVSCFPTISLNRAKCAIWLHTLSVQSDCTLGWTACGVIKEDCFQTNLLQKTKLKYVTMQLNTFVNFMQMF